MVEMLPSNRSWRGQGQRVATLFATEPEVVACGPPLGSVRSCAALRMACEDHEMREFVQKSAGEFLGESKQAGIEENEGAVGTGKPRGGAQPWLPAQGQSGGEGWKTEFSCPGATLKFKLPRNLRGIGRAALGGSGRCEHQKIGPAARLERRRCCAVRALGQEFRVVVHGGVIMAVLPSGVEALPGRCAGGIILSYAEAVWIMPLLCQT